jgi:hypothetical protein
MAQRAGTKKERSIAREPEIAGLTFASGEIRARPPLNSHESMGKRSEQEEDTPERPEDLQNRENG